MPADHQRYPHPENARALRLGASVTRIRAEFEAEIQAHGFTAAALRDALCPLQSAQRATETLCSLGARVRNIYLAPPAAPAIRLDLPGDLRQWLDSQQASYSEIDTVAGRAVYCARLHGCDVIWWEDA